MALASAVLAAACSSSDGQPRRIVDVDDAAAGAGAGNAALLNSGEFTAVKPPRTLQIDGRRLMTTGGKAFEWRGVTAFRLLDHLADRRARDADAYLDWARKTGFNVLRVLTRLDTWAELSTADGQRLLPDLLTVTHRSTTSVLSQ
jgi:hypothetical protein